MSEKPLISVCVPVYNVEEYLSQCMDSIVSQTLKDIEIICVDDRSTDKSSEILDAYSNRDYRIKVIKKQRNEGSLLARKTAVLASSGKYIVFLDSDDYLSKNDSLSLMLDLIEKEAVDMLEFSVGINNKFNRINVSGYENRLKNQLININGHDNLIKYFFCSRFSWYIWTKIYKGDIVRYAFNFIEDKYFVMWEDVYITFVISYFTETFKSVETKPLINYRVGVGVSTNNNLSINQFKRIVDGFKILESMKKFIDVCEDKVKYQYLVKLLQNHFSQTLCNLVFKLSEKDFKEGCEKLSETLDSKDYLKYSFFSHIKYKILSALSWGYKKEQYIYKKRKYDLIKSFLNY